MNCSAWQTYKIPQPSVNFCGLEKACCSIDDSYYAHYMTMAYPTINDKCADLWASYYCDLFCKPISYMNLCDNYYKSLQLECPQINMKDRMIKLDNTSSCFHPEIIKTGIRRSPEFKKYKSKTQQHLKASNSGVFILFFLVLLALAFTFEN